jgi:hypothetical protein
MKEFIFLLIGLSPFIVREILQYASERREIFLKRYEDTLRRIVSLHKILMVHYSAIMRGIEESERANITAFSKRFFEEDYFSVHEHLQLISVICNHDESLIDLDRLYIEHTHKFLIACSSAYDGIEMKNNKLDKSDFQKCLDQYAITWKQYSVALHEKISHINKLKIKYAGPIKEYYMAKYKINESSEKNK